MTINQYQSTHKLQGDNDLLANAMVGLIVSEIDEEQFADILHGLWSQSESN